MNIVRHNLSAMNTSRQLNITTSNAQKTSEKLSSGYKINRSADDAAGLSISEKMRSQIRGLNRGADNLQDGISYVQVADGALNEVHSMLHRINELAVQSANGTNSVSDRKSINQEVQMLKTEMERIFTSTTFNDQPIWPEGSIYNAPVVVGTRPVQALEVTTPATQEFDLTNANYDKIASSSYTILADQQGVSLTWSDYNNTTHTTSKISWSKLKENKYQFQIGDYFNPNDTELFDVKGKPVFDFKVSFSVAEGATTKNIIDAINNTTMSTSTFGYISNQFEDANGNPVSINGVSLSASMTIGAIYATRANATGNETGYDYDQPNDSFAEPSPGTNKGNIIHPNITSVSTAQTSTDTWSFEFELDGIGKVTATSNRIRYYSNDKSANAENVWWRYEKNSITGKMEQRTIFHDSNKYGEGTLGSIMDCLTGPNDPNSNTDTPGLLHSEQLNTGDGYIWLDFDMVSESSFTYGNRQPTNDVGNMTLTIRVNANDTEATVLDKINKALNDANFLDLYTTDSNLSNTDSTVRASSRRKVMANKPVYQDNLFYGNVDVTIHGGPSTRDKLNIKYQCLRLGSLKLEDANVLSEKAADATMNAVSNAIIIVNKQRSAFGAYQNRLEHSLAVNENTAENTTAAESRIRDTDMAETVVEHSKESILLQTAQSMLSQSNGNAQSVLTLLK